MRVTSSERCITVRTSCSVAPPSNSRAVRRVETWSRRVRYLSSVASAWLALASTTGISSRMYFAPSTYSDTTSRRWETAMTRASVCLETRSAVRWRVPVSEERIVGIADHEQATGARVDDVVDPFPHRRARRDHLQRLDQPGFLPRFELCEL